MTQETNKAHNTIKSLCMGFEISVEQITDITNDTKALLKIMYLYALRKEGDIWGKDFALWPKNEVISLAQRFYNFSPVIDSINDKILEIDEELKQLESVIEKLQKEIRGG